MPGIRPAAFLVKDRPSRLFSAQQETVQRSPGWDWIFTCMVAENAGVGMQHPVDLGTVNAFSDAGFPQFFLPLFALSSCFALLKKGG